MFILIHRLSYGWLEKKTRSGGKGEEGKNRIIIISTDLAGS